MKLKMLLLMAVIFVSGQISGADKLEAGKKEKQSYAMGVDIASRLKAQAIPLDTYAFILGIKDVLTNEKLLYSEKELRELLIALQTELKEKQDARNKKDADINKKAEEEFLTANGKKAGVITTSSGLQYKVIKEGNGKIPGVDDTVVCHYRGKLSDGTEFDSSHKRGEPAEFPVKGVIPGWTEALQMMKAGSIWEVVVPSHMAYGEVGAAGIIGPNAVLVFEIELISVK